jgi:hypothetical protein
MKVDPTQFEARFATVARGAVVLETALQTHSEVQRYAQFHAEVEQAMAACAKAVGHFRSDDLVQAVFAMRGGWTILLEAFENLKKEAVPVPGMSYSVFHRFMPWLIPGLNAFSLSLDILGTRVAAIIEAVCTSGPSWTTEEVVFVEQILGPEKQKWFRPWEHVYVEPR